ncbi:MAG: DUF1684 domain-containing protein [Polaribacter sp.]|jgi:uncharacterized protein (DUF1684 family)|nr:DUF1684 domain-containing protein [Polaribacter sp.]MDC1374998.1 DUF1684 domain-containing protein [Polaribacter sp.]MDG1320476.1 DUF1684 domain-containing protein [Polaribacter sp.]
MRKIISFITLILLMSACNSQRKKTLIGATEYQQKLNESYKDGSKSPLKKNDLKNFKGLEFYPVDSSFIVTARLTKTKDATTFEMATTTDRKPLYKEYGILTFTLKGIDCSLTVYQSQDDLRDEKYKDFLFLPFTDNSSGNGSYAGGRYMDVMTTDEKTDGTIVLNFNNSYNPYCAYNEKYSCPLTPRQNHLSLAVKAGIKDFKK